MKTYDCVAIDDNEIILKLLESYITKTQNLVHKASFTDPLKAIDYLNHESVDILLLDIEMPDISGIELLKILPNLPATILITSKPEFALEAFDLDVIDYILKPPQYARFLKAVQKVTRLMPADGPMATLEYFYVKVGNKLVRIELDNLCYVEALSDYVILHTEDKRQYIVYATLKSLEEKLATHAAFLFKRVHRSFIINLEKIDSIDASGNYVNIAGKDIPVGNTYKEAFLKNLHKL